MPKRPEGEMWLRRPHLSSALLSDVEHTFIEKELL